MHVWGLIIDNINEFINIFVPKRYIFLQPITEALNVNLLDFGNSEMSGFKFPRECVTKKQKHDKRKRPVTLCMVHTNGFTKIKAKIVSNCDKTTKKEYQYERTTILSNEGF